MTDKIKKLLHEAKKRGYKVRNGSKHIKVYARDGKHYVTVARSASDKRAFLNIRRDFRHVLKLAI